MDPEITDPMNPWISIWFRPGKVASWLKQNKPLYGVVAIIAMMIVAQYLAASVSTSAAEQPSADTEISAISGFIGFAVDAIIFPFLFVYLVYWIAARQAGEGSLGNVFSVIVWSQLPVLLVTVALFVTRLMDVRVDGPVLTNQIEIKHGLVTLIPPVPEIDPIATAWMLGSTVFYLWSFQILLVGLSAVENLRVKRVIWVITLAAVALMIARIPITMILGDRTMLELLGLSEFIEMA